MAVTTLITQFLIMISNSAGHSSIEPETRHLLIATTKNMLKNQS